MDYESFIFSFYSKIESLPLLSLFSLDIFDIFFPEEIAFVSWLDGEEEFFLLLSFTHYYFSLEAKYERLIYIISLTLFALALMINFVVF